MRPDTAADQTVTDLKHRVRGLAAAYKARHFVKDRSAHPTDTLRSGLRSLLLDARVALHASQFDEFLNWTNHFLAQQIPELARLPVGYGDLAGVVVDAPVADLDSELLWVSARIRIDAPKLNAFCAAGRQIEQDVFHNRFESAIESLKSIDETFGVSLWSVELRIAIEHYAGGLERQKRYTSDVRAIHRRGLLGFVAYHTSVRNEDRTTLAKFTDDIRARIDRHRYFETFVKTYARYRLAGDWPVSEGGLAEILRVEQSHSLIDVYETFVAVIQEIVRREHLSHARRVALRCLQDLSSVKDFRLAKAAQLLGDLTGYSQLQPRETKASDALLGGQIGQAAWAARRLVRSVDAVDPWQIIYAGLVFAHSSRVYMLPVHGPAETFQLVASIMSRSPDGDALAQLAKLGANLHGLPTAVGLMDMLQQVQRSRPDDPWRPWLVGMNSATAGIEDLLPSYSGTGGGDPPVQSASSTPTSAAWSHLHHPASSESEVSGAPAALAAMGLLRQTRVREAENLLRRVLQTPVSEPLNALLHSLLLHAQFALADHGQVVALVAKQGARGSAHRRFLPIAASLQQYTWDDYKLALPPIVRPVALHLLWTMKETETTASHLRFATKMFLRTSGIHRPSRLFEQVDAYDRDLLIYFLREVCVPNVLESAAALKGSLQVMEERQAVCAALRLLDPSNAATYENEVLAISNQQALSEGEWIVDRTRIHVDATALSRWAHKELAEDFARYKDLSAVDLGAHQNFDDVLKELLENSVAHTTVFKAESEADTVIASIVQQLKEEFLNNPSFGLDFYLSKRIRHQSFIGLIRGPLEFAQLITTRETGSGEYRRNDFWLDKFKYCTSEAKESLEAAFSRCAAKFDDILITAKDTNFHVRSINKPGGLLSIELTPQLLILARTVARIDITLTDFVNTAVAILWGALEPSLERVRRFIAEDLKTKIAESFDELRASVRKHAEDDPALLEFDMEIGRRSTDVQRALDEAAAWFTTGTVEARDRHFRLDQIVKIATDCALKCQRAFTPTISSSVTKPDMQMDASALLLVHDVLFVALDNVRAHSGLSTPAVNVHVEPNQDDGTLTIRIVSETRAQSRAAGESRIAEIRRTIDEGSAPGGSRREGGSGFLKLAAVVQQSTKGRIAFGFTDEGKFELTVVYSLLVQQLSVSEH